MTFASCCCRWPTKLVFFSLPQCLTTIIPICACVVCLLGCFQPLGFAQSAVNTSARELPLNHFPYRISHPQQPDGSIHLETAVGDDYFDGTSSVQRVRRHLKTAHD